MDQQQYGDERVKRPQVNTAQQWQYERTLIQLTLCVLIFQILQLLKDDYQHYVQKKRSNKSNKEVSKPQAKCKPIPSKGDSSKHRPSTDDAPNDITNQLLNLTIDNPSAPNKNPTEEEHSILLTEGDDLKEGLRKNHEQELQDMTKVVKKLFADDILEDVPGAAVATVEVPSPGATATVDDEATVVNNDDDQIPDRFYQRSAKVVYIIEKVHSRACTGYLKKPGSKV